MMKVDLLLSCGHVEIVPVEAAILLPEIGDPQLCSKCNAEFQIQDVGVPWHENGLEKRNES